MAKREGFFKRIKNLISEGNEEGISEFAETDIADTSIQDPEVSELPSLEYIPNTEGVPSVEASFYSGSGFSAEEGREVEHLDVRYRQEHEPYRFEPEGDKNVCVTRARLYELHPLTNNITTHELKPLKIKVLDEDCVVYTEFDTTNQGAIKDGADPKEGKYRLKVAEDLPAPTHFELPDEDGGGVDGKYYIPLFYVKNGQISRDHWNTEGDDQADENNPRTVQLFGGLRGHRGPFWWHRGYNTISNLGGGKNIYKDYLKFTDEKRLRSLDEKTQEGLTQPFTGEAQVQVQYNGAGTEIEIFGNRYNKHWKVGGVGVAVVEDGLVTCLNDLNSKECKNRVLTPVDVLTSAGSVTVLKAGSSTTVGGNPTSANLTSVLNTTTTTYVAKAPDTSEGSTDMVDVWHGGTATSVWTGGASSAGGGLTPVKVSKCGSTTDCVWVLGIDASGSYESSAPTFPSYITGAALSAGITGASFTSVVKSLSTTAVVNGVTTTNVLKDLPPVDVVTSTETESVLKAGSGSTASVYKAHASGTHNYLEAPSGISDGADVLLVESPDPDNGDLCPAGD